MSSEYALTGRSLLSVVRMVARVCTGAARAQLSFLATVSVVDDQIFALVNDVYALDGSTSGGGGNKLKSKVIKSGRGGGGHKCVRKSDTYFVAIINNCRLNEEHLEALKDRVWAAVTTADDDDDGVGGGGGDSDSDGGDGADDTTVDGGNSSDDDDDGNGLGGRLEECLDEANDVCIDVAIQVGSITHVALVNHYTLY
jgi:hypothetical protein